MRRVAYLLGLLIGAVALVGCTLVSTTSSHRAITPKDVPFCLRCKTIPGTNNGSVHFISQPVYIVDATGHLAPSSRIVPSPPVLESVLRQLIIGPTKIESFAGYTSALPKDLVHSLGQHPGRYRVHRPRRRRSRNCPAARRSWPSVRLVLTAKDVGLTLGVAVKGIEITVGRA